MLDEEEVKDNMEIEDNEDEEILSEEELETQDTEEVIVDKKSGEKPSFFLSLAAIVSDSIIVGALSLAILFLADIIMRNVVGYYIVEKVQMSVILYVIISIVYASIIEASLGFTVGKTIFGLKVVRE
jgi:hypothetical protein